MIESAENARSTFSVCRLAGSAGGSSEAGLAAPPPGVRGPTSLAAHGHTAGTHTRTPWAQRSSLRCNHIMERTRQGQVVHAPGGCWHCSHTSGPGGCWHCSPTSGAHGSWNHISWNPPAKDRRCMHQGAAGTLTDLTHTPRLPTSCLSTLMSAAPAMAPESRVWLAGETRCTSGDRQGTLREQAQSLGQTK